MILNCVQTYKFNRHVNDVNCTLLVLGGFYNYEVWTCFRLQKKKTAKARMMRAATIATIHNTTTITVLSALTTDAGSATESETKDGIEW